MEKDFWTIINRFDGGMLEDKRAGWEGSIANGFTTRYFGLAEHLDIFTNFKKLIPHKIGGQTTTDQAKNIVKFIEGEGVLYGLGVVAGTSRIKLFKYSGDAAQTWSACTTAEGGAAYPTRNEDVFFYYKGFLYAVIQSSGAISRWEIATNTFTDVYQNLVGDGATATSTWVQPVHHSGDDCAYFFFDNIVERLDDTVWDGVVLTLPSNLKIVSACEYGNYLAIGCTGKNTKKAVVYLWDRDSSLETITQVIDFGEGDLKHIANLNNKLIGVVNYFTDNAYGVAEGKILIKQASGNFAKVLREILTDTKVTDYMSATKVVSENKLYFPAGPQLRGDTRLGIWVTDENGVVSLEFAPSVTSYEGIYRIGRSWFIANSGDGSIWHTIYNTAQYENGISGVYETLIFNAGDSDLRKKLIGVTVMFEDFSAAGGEQVVLKYRKDGDTTWTTLFTFNTANSISHGTVNTEATGAELPEYREIEFRLEALNGAKITGLKFKSRAYEKGLY